MKTEIDTDFSSLPEDDLIMLEALIMSPAFAALKRALDKYRAACNSVLLSATESNRMFQTQGRIIGINTIENLPKILVQQRQVRIKKAEAERQLEEKRKKPPETPDPRGILKPKRDSV